MIETLYSNVSSNDVVSAYKYGQYAKVNIVIEIKEIKKGISIKNGVKNSVHGRINQIICLLFERLWFQGR